MSAWEEENWDHGDWTAEEDALVTCPECGKEVYLDLNDEQCPECGYWFLPEDRNQMWRQAGGAKANFMKLVALVVVLALLLPLILHFLS